MLGKTRVLIRQLALFIGLFCCIQTSYADSGGPGIGFTYPIIATEPEELHGYRASLSYQPKSFIWSYVKLYFDGSFGHWWVDEIPKNRSANRELNIYSIAPVARFYYKQNEYITPFIDMSIGLSYLTQTYMHTRNLGMHFSFQDQLSFGAIFGTEQRISVSLSGLHYSNGSLCNRNSGMTIPFSINVGFQL